MSTSLPPLYAAWMDEIVREPVPQETEATCEQCVMCSTRTALSSGASQLFNAQTKCCTYMPVLANFLVGGILFDHDPELTKGRATVEERIEKGVAVSPLGLGRTGVYTLLYEHSPGAFGRSQALIERGLCISQ